MTRDAEMTNKCNISECTQDIGKSVNNHQELIQLQRNTLEKGGRVIDLFEKYQTLVDN